MPLTHSLSRVLTRLLVAVALVALVGAAAVASSPVVSADEALDAALASGSVDATATAVEQYGNPCEIACYNAAFACRNACGDDQVCWDDCSQDLIDCLQTC